jgi:hypothetical protein
MASRRVVRTLLAVARLSEIWSILATSFENFATVSFPSRRIHSISADLYSANSRRHSSQLPVSIRTGNVVALRRQTSNFTSTDYHVTYIDPGKSGIRFALAWLP